MTDDFERVELVDELLSRWLDAAAPRGPNRLRPVNAFADVVSSILTDPDRTAQALRRFGRRMAVEGWSLPDLASFVHTLGDVEPRLAPTLDRFAAGVSLADGWADGARVPGGDRSCRDPLTGLATTGVLRIRLEQVYAECRAHGVDPQAAYRFVVVDCDAGGAASPFVRDATHIVVAEQLRATFRAGETICAAGSGRMVVLARASDGLADQTAAVLETLGHTPLLSRVPVLAWVEALPAEPGELGAFLSDVLATAS